MARPAKVRPTSVEIYEGADGSWHGYLTVGLKPDGRPDRRHRMGKDRDTVAEKIRQLEDQLASGAVAAPGRPQTLQQWLTHWVENIARPSVSYSTYENTYAYAVYQYLIPGLGAHRLDLLEPEHIEVLYRSLLGTSAKPGRLSAGTVALIHRTLSAALNEAVVRGRLPSNPAKVAKHPESEPEDIVPLSRDEVHRILAVLVTRRNGVRWLFAMLGLRQGEVLGLQWTDVDLENGILTVRGQASRRKWQHGCDDQARCARWRHGCNPGARCGLDAWSCPRREVRCRLKACPPAWEHGCDDRARCAAKLAYACPARRPKHCPDHRNACPPPCSERCTKHAATCPQRVGGGVVIDDGSEREERLIQRGRRRLRTKTKAGERKLALPKQLLDELRDHRARQNEERLRAGSTWHDRGLVFASVTGSPIDARRDWGDWKDLLSEAGVRDVRVHDARHTAATFLLMKGVDRGVVMAIMGWTSEQMVRRYQHVVDELLHDAAARLGQMLWDQPEQLASSSATDHATGPSRSVAARRVVRQNRRLKAV